MNIIIVGSGKVGSHIAEQLVREKHDVTIIDHNEEILRRLAETLDIMKNAQINMEIIIIIM